MSTGSGKQKRSSSNTRSAAGRSASANRSGNSRRRADSKSRVSSVKRSGKNSQASDDVVREIKLVVFLGIAVLVFLSVCGVLGEIGNVPGNVLIGLFGMIAYVLPFAFFFISAYSLYNAGMKVVRVKVAATVILMFVLSCFAQLIFDYDNKPAKLTGYYTQVAKNGGFFGGVVDSFLCKFITLPGTVVVLIVVLVICVVLLTERSFFRDMKDGGRNLAIRMKKDREYRDEKAKIRQLEWEEEQEEKKQRRAIRQEDRNLRMARLEAEREARLNERRQRTEEARKSRLEDKKRHDEEMAKVRPLMTIERTTDVENADSIDRKQTEANADASNLSTQESLGIDNVSKGPEALFYGSASNVLSSKNAERNDNSNRNAPVSLMEGTLLKNEEYYSSNDIKEITDNYSEGVYDLGNRNVHTAHPIELSVEEDELKRENYERDIYMDDSDTFEEDYADVADWEEKKIQKAEEKHSSKVYVPKSAPDMREKAAPTSEDTIKGVRASSAAARKSTNGRYKLPAASLLNEIKNTGKNDAQDELNETAKKLKDILATFGVNVTIIGASRGPAVTRYELQPEVGVKVSKIVSLTDDIKLSLAAADIRMEAPIPGKSAIGIEVPNKENSMVPFRELVESRTFKDAKSKISFAVGKDLSGQVVVNDLGKMPHVLIAGATGSGKSVCINTLIMSILYKATPEEVKLIMIDPKVVELSVYNGIPHLLIPVVTDPRKASAALQWAVNEMMNRYDKFKELGVRDMAGFNKKVESDSTLIEQGYSKLPQIVVIVDELADLMMVAGKEVEESICRLAQLARAAGIHLVIATQRPSVNVITGLIKANMPSRIAFSVTSGVDSRTILDMIGAEKLLGKGDMLFYPQGYTKPARVQGAFVSDDEVSNVVDYIKGQQEVSYDMDALNKLDHADEAGNAAAGATGLANPEEEGDPLFYECGRSIIQKQKASIGMLQRMHKIGFNRAARIMDSLAEAGVVSPEEGTKPRTVLMTIEQFEEYIRERNHT